MAWSMIAAKTAVNSGVLAKREMRSRRSGWNSNHRGCTTRWEKPRESISMVAGRYEGVFDKKEDARVDVGGGV